MGHTISATSLQCPREMTGACSGTRTKHSAPRGPGLLQLPVLMNSFTGTQLHTHVFTYCSVAALALELAGRIETNAQTPMVFATCPFSGKTASLPLSLSLSPSLLRSLSLFLSRLVYYLATAWTHWGSPAN